MDTFQIITFYEFRRISADLLPDLRASLRSAMGANSVKGTIILAEEGFNGTVCAEPENLPRFVNAAEAILETRLRLKSSFHSTCPFRRIDVKIKREIVTLKKQVNIDLGKGTHVDAKTWTDLISDPGVIVLDTRNDYEFRSGTFKRAINPSTEKFSDLPEFVARNLDPEQHPKIAMFCTGGIRCEKFAAYMKEIGFREVFQLEGGILKYLEETRPAESLWEGECFVFDDRVTVDGELKKGVEPDHSQDVSRPLK